MASLTTTPNETEELALNGGEPVIKEPLPSLGGGGGVQSIDDAEIEAVAAVLRSKTCSGIQSKARCASENDIRIAKAPVRTGALFFASLNNGGDWMRSQSALRAA